MNILYVNKFFHLVGGVERYFFELGKLMEARGNRTSYFYMQSAADGQSRWADFAVSNVSYDNSQLYQRLRQFIRLFYSPEANNKISRLIDQVKPDIVHLHTIYHHLSPSILPAVKKKHLPIVQNLGDYHLISPNYNLFHNGAVCEITLGGRFYKAIAHRCIRNSRFYSSIEVLEKYFHQLAGWEHNLIDKYISPSVFMKKKLIESGIREEKIRTIPHFIISHEYPYRKSAGEYLLYFGRLSPEKGLLLLLKAMKNLPDIKLKIAGRGQQEDELKNFVKEKRMKNVEFSGFLEGAALKKVISRSLAVILPSLWPEVFGMSILEAFACGKPVIASDIGGIPELVDDNYTGYLFKPGDLDDLLEKIKKLSGDKGSVIRLGGNARKMAVDKFNPVDHYRKVMKLYGEMI